MKLKWSNRVCEVCGIEFMIRDCYLKRAYHNGRFCSIKCQHVGFRGTGNPKASKYAAYGSKVSAHKRQLDRYQKLRNEALTKLALVWNTPIACVKCGCDFQSMLQCNHTVVFKSRQSGAKLWRHILKISNKELKEQFDIRCQLCNWAFHLQKKYPNTDYSIEWKGSNCSQN